jgi:YfiH family protein
MIQPAVDFKYITVEEWRSNPSVIHGFGNREMTEDDLHAMCKMKGLAPVRLRQIHSDIIHPLLGAPQRELIGDALLTDRPGLLLLIKTADCLPVLILSERPRAIAAVHCGWRGTSLGLVAETVLKMDLMYGCDPASLQAAFGPSIGLDCYEVGEEVRLGFGRTGHDSSVFKSHPQRKDKYLFDLRQASRLQLLSCGVRKEKIYSVPHCTRCDVKFYSYRRDPSSSGRMLNFIGLLP